jgi:hypothetical protein
MQTRLFHAVFVVGAALGAAACSDRETIEIDPDPSPTVTHPPRTRADASVVVTDAAADAPDASPSDAQAHDGMPVDAHGDVGWEPTK